MQFRFIRDDAFNQFRQMKRNIQFSIASFLLVTTVFALLLTLFRFLKGHSPPTYLLLWVISLTLSILGVTLILGAFSGYWENRFSSDLATAKGKDVIGVVYIGLCFLIPAIAFCFEAYAIAD